jgi:YVTN family beta-propeller protein
MLCVVGAGVPAAQAQSHLYLTGGGPPTLVRVIDTATKAIVAAIPADEGAFGIVASPDGSRVYVATQSTGRVAAIDTASHRIVATIPVEFVPTYLAISADGSRVYAGKSGRCERVRHRHREQQHDCDRARRRPAECVDRDTRRDARLRGPVVRRSRRGD